MSIILLKTPRPLHPSQLMHVTSSWPASRFLARSGSLMKGLLMDIISVTPFSRRASMHPLVRIPLANPIGVGLIASWNFSS